MQNFGEAIKTFRKSSGLTQTQFADRLGVHLQTISKWERGLLAPDFSLLGEIASVLSVSLEALLGLPQSEETFTGSFDMASFGRALAEARKKKNESQSELAEALGVSTDNISKWERGVICPDAYELVSLATHFDLPASKLYFGICEETEVESPAQWRRRKRLHILWFVCAVLPLCAIVVVLSVLLAVLPRTELAERTEFSINYWLCGGAFRTEVAGTIRAEDGEVTLAVPQKEGSEFLGWYRSPDYAGEQVRSIVCEGEDISVYAKWSDLSYEIRYELGGGVLPENNPALVTAAESLPLNDPVRKGYLFLGWFDAPENGVHYERVGGEGAKNLTLYAVWQKCDTTFSVRYELGGGVQASGNPLRLAAGEICSLHAPEKRGHDFLGWNERADGSGKYFTVLYGISEDITLYAIYSPKDYLVRYVYEGAYPGEEVNPNRITFGQTVPLLPVSLYGNEFLGWFTAETGGERVETIDEGNLPELSVLYAHFRPKTFSVFLDAGGGAFEIDGESLSEYTLKVEYGRPQTLPEPVREEYLFLGWTDEAGNTVKEIDIYNLDDLSLTAKWRPVELRYSIRYELGGGVQNENNPTEGVSGKRINLYDPQKTGYLFLGWFEDEEGRGTRYEYIPEDRAEDIVLYAVWQEIRTVGSADCFRYERGANTVKITGYTGATGDNVDLAFPAVIDGLPVTEIMQERSRLERAVFHAVTIPESVTVLGDNAFARLTVTEPLMIPSAVERIGRSCFEKYEGKICFSEHGSLSRIGDSAFRDVQFGETLILPQGVTTIESGAFNGLRADGVILPDTVQTIGSYAFQTVPSVTLNLFLPSSVVFIDDSAFVLAHVYTTLTDEQTENFSGNWAMTADVHRLGEKRELTLSDGGYTETSENYGFVLPRRKKEGSTFLGWQNGKGEFVPNYYFPEVDETLYAAYEEETPADGRTKARAIPLKTGESYEIAYVSAHLVYFIWEGNDAVLQFNQKSSRMNTYLLRDGKLESFYLSCECRKGDLICIGGDWALPGTVLSFTVSAI